SGQVAVYDLGTGTSLASAPLSSDNAFWKGQFVGRDRLRLFRDSRLQSVPAEDRIEILELDLSTKTLTTTGKGSDLQFFYASPTGDRLLCYEKNRLVLRDPRSAALLSSLAERGPERQVVGRFLSDGRI